VSKTDFINKPTLNGHRKWAKDKMGQTHDFIKNQSLEYKKHGFSVNILTLFERKQNREELL
jgi:hypothetical protein